MLSDQRRVGKRKTAYRLERQKHPEPIEIVYFVVAVYGSTQPDRSRR
jgi:hypothetical protein